MPLAEIFSFSFVTRGAEGGLTSEPAPVGGVGFSGFSTILWREVPKSFWSPKLTPKSWSPARGWVRTPPSNASLVIVGNCTEGPVQDVMLDKIALAWPLSRSACCVRLPKLTNLTTTLSFLGELVLHMSLCLRHSKEVELWEVVGRSKRGEQELQQRQEIREIEELAAQEVAAGADRGTCHGPTPVYVFTAERESRAPPPPRTVWESLQPYGWWAGGGRARHPHPDGSEGPPPGLPVPGVPNYITKIIIWRRRNFL